MNTELTPDMIIKVVCEYYDTNYKLLRSKCRRHIIVKPRQICLYFIGKFTSMSLDSMALMFSMANHTGPFHAIKNVNNIIDTDKVFRSEIQEISWILKEKLSQEYEVYQQNDYFLDEPVMKEVQELIEDPPFTNDYKKPFGDGERIVTQPFGNVRML